MAPGLISTTADMWSADMTKLAFLDVTAHWIDMKGREGEEMWEMHSEVISFQSVSGDHSGKNLGQYFVGVCDRIGIMNTKRSKVQSGLSFRFWYWMSDASIAPHSYPWQCLKQHHKMRNYWSDPWTMKYSLMVCRWESTSMSFTSTF